ncbi:MAG: hypothetical protein IPO46_05575 [Chitinophagaceae bacterium]|mgnify:FL=1|jgi:hypothetical protein|nr:hypothetical protein [Chitinophagaceae bacterium]MBP6046452.1 hypothetical protein [Ferruginibacter sp.]NMD29632.1 hypothetical protein [Bacteroidota bacterium]MBK7089207.1 hypothetical protein [Chitinophagaceae bacterium]MBK7347624.1 hypothetical protein [Chitinophagaceae bacterium]
MLEELFNLVKNVAGESASNSTEIAPDQQTEVVAEATNTVASGLRNIVAGGGIQSLISLLSGNNQQQGKSSLLSNPIVSMMIGHFAGKLMNKMNIGNAQASSIANSLIPGVISSLIGNINDSGNSAFSIENLLKSITGGQTEQVAQQNPQFNITNLINQFTGVGNGQQQQQSPGILEVIGQLAQGAQQQQARNGGGLLDLIKGFTQ